MDGQELTEEECQPYLDEDAKAESQRRVKLEADVESWKKSQEIRVYLAWCDEEYDSLSFQLGDQEAFDR